MIYKARKNVIVDQCGYQVAVVLASNCTKKDAAKMAKFAADGMNAANAKPQTNEYRKTP